MNKSERVVVARDADGVIIGWNSGAEHLFGYGAAEVLGLSIDRLIPAEDLEREDALLKRLERGEHVDPIIVNHVHKDGRRIPIRVAVGLTSDLDGRRAVVTEVADSNSAESGQRRVGRRSRLGRRRNRAIDVEIALASLPFGALLIDSNGRIAGANASAERMFGRPSGGLNGCHVGELSDELVAEKYATPLERVSVRPRRRELAARRSDGKKFPLRAAFSAVRAGSEPFTLAIVADLTARRANEAETRERRHLFRQMMEGLTDFVWTCSPDGSADEFSPQWVTFTGVPADEQLGVRWMNQVHAEDREGSLLAGNRRWKMARLSRASFACAATTVSIAGSRRASCRCAIWPAT